MHFLQELLERFIVLVFCQEKRKKELESLHYFKVWEIIPVNITVSKQILIAALCSKDRKYIWLHFFSLGNNISQPSALTLA